MGSEDAALVLLHMSVFATQYDHNIHADNLNLGGCFKVKLMRLTWEHDLCSDEEEAVAGRGK